MSNPLFTSDQLNELLSKVPVERQECVERYFKDLQRKTEEFIKDCNKREDDIRFFMAKPLKEKTIEEFLFLCNSVHLTRNEILNLLELWGDQINKEYKTFFNICLCQNDIPPALVPFGNMGMTPPRIEIEKELKPCVCQVK